MIEPSPTSLRPIARVGDRVEGICRHPNHGPRAFFGFWVEGTNRITLDGKDVIRVDDWGTTDCGHRFHAIEGFEFFTDIENRRLHRVGDAVLVDEGGEGVTVSGSPVGGTL